MSTGVLKKELSLAITKITRLDRTQTDDDGTTPPMNVDSGRFLLLLFLCFSGGLFFVYNDRFVGFNHSGDATFKTKHELTFNKSCDLAGGNLQVSPNGRSIPDEVLSCVWAPNTSRHNDTECGSLLLSRLNPPPDVSTTSNKTSTRRWLFLGDSTIGKLFKDSGIQERLLNTRVLQKNCEGLYRCSRHEHERCDLNRYFQLPEIKKEHWKPPNFTRAEGPCAYGFEHYNCQDCSGCNSIYTICKPQKTFPSNFAESCPGQPYGGYFSVEFAKDVEIQTNSTHSTQEAVVNFVTQQFNNDCMLLKDFHGFPICVTGNGLHDMAIPNVTLSSYLSNVEWYLTVLKQQCSHIIWLLNTAPSKNYDESKYPQTRETVKLWNQRTLQMLRQSQDKTLKGKVTVMDVFNASIEFGQYNDRIHLKSAWYQALGDVFLYVMDNLRDAIS